MPGPKCEQYAAHRNRRANKASISSDESLAAAGVAAASTPALPEAPVVPSVATASSACAALDATLGLHAPADASSAFRAGGVSHTASRVSVQPRSHRYQSVVFASTSVSVSLAVDNIKFARCRDKLLAVPERRYEGLQNMKPAALIVRYGWDCGCSLLKGILTLGAGATDRTLRSVTASDTQRRQRQVGRDDVLDVAQPGALAKDGSAGAASEGRMGQMLRKLRVKGGVRKGDQNEGIKAPDSLAAL